MLRVHFFCHTAKTLNLPICSNDKLYIRASKVAENALFWLFLVGTTKNAKNKDPYTAITVVVVVYKVSRSHLQRHSTPTPPDSRLKQRPYPNEKFFIFFSKNKVMVSIEKNKLFLFIYFSFYNIYII